MVMETYMITLLMLIIVTYLITLVMRIMRMEAYLITLVPPNSELLSLSSSRFSFARTEDSPAVKILMVMLIMMMAMMTMMMMMMMAVGGLHPTNRLGSWVEQPNRMNLSL